VRVVGRDASARPADSAAPARLVHLSARLRAHHGRRGGHRWRAVDLRLPVRALGHRRLRDAIAHARPRDRGDVQRALYGDRDRAHRITAFNRAAEEITGVTSKQAIGRSWSALIGTTVPLASIEAAIDGNARASMRHETALRRPDGSTVPVRMTFSALRSGEGERLGLISACEDLSAIRAMESRMRQADRLATVGRMAANIAHEIRNPLA